MNRLLSLVVLTLIGCVGVQTSSLDYDWYYSSSIQESFDKFEGVGTIGITPVDVESSTNGIDQNSTHAKINFHYHYKNEEPLGFAYLSVYVDSYSPQLEDSELIFEKDGILHKGILSRYKKYPRQVGRASIGSYGGSYNESTRFTEAASYKFKLDDLCPFNRVSSFEFKAGKIYKLSQGYSVSIDKWCKSINSVRVKSKDQHHEGRP